jgi:hypothetical protein
MTIIANAAYFGSAGKIEIGAAVGTVDDYTAAVTSCALVPNAPTAQVQDIGGGVQSFVGANAWQAQIGYNQDWTTAGSLSKQLIAWHGLTKVFKYTPNNGGQVVTFTALIQAGQVGGAAATVHAATVNLQLIGQPTFA